MATHKHSGGFTKVKKEAATFTSAAVTTDAGNYGNGYGDKMVSMSVQCLHNVHMQQDREGLLNHRRQTSISAEGAEPEQPVTNATCTMAAFVPPPAAALRKAIDRSRVTIGWNTTGGQKESNCPLKSEGQMVSHDLALLQALLGQVESDQLTAVLLNRSPQRRQRTH